MHKVLDAHITAHMHIRYKATCGGLKIYIEMFLSISVTALCTVALTLDGNVNQTRVDRDKPRK